ncbi:hypothetical protein AcW2_005366 [Taiwanofungus camphoratus]|nr:hypothetical protein AcW2_005366 [Antrodia cinnamomea]
MSVGRTGGAGLYRGALTYTRTSGEYTIQYPKPRTADSRARRAVPRSRTEAEPESKAGCGAGRDVRGEDGIEGNRKRKYLVEVAEARDRDAHRCAHNTSQDEHSAYTVAVAHTRVCAAHRCKARASDRKYRAAGRAANSSRKAARPPSEMMSDGTREEGGT